MNVATWKRTWSLLNSWSSVWHIKKHGYLGTAMATKKCKRGVKTAGWLAQRLYPVFQSVNTVCKATMHPRHVHHTAQSVYSEDQLGHRVTNRMSKYCKKFGSTIKSLESTKHFRNYRNMELHVQALYVEDIFIIFCNVWLHFYMLCRVIHNLKVVFPNGAGCRKYCISITL